MVVKFLAMCSYGVLIGFAIHDAIAHPPVINGRAVSVLVATVWAAGVPEVFLALFLIIFQLSFLIWRRKSVSYGYQELNVNSVDPANEVWK